MNLGGELAGSLQRGWVKVAFGMTIGVALAGAGVVEGLTIVGTPSVTAVSPTCGNSAGGTHVSLTGTNFQTASAADFGGTAGTGFGSDSDTTAHVTSPAHAAGVVDVHVTNGLGTSPSNPPSDHFTFEDTPSVSSVGPSHGSTGGGTSVVIHGTGFSFVSVPSDVQFGGVNAASYHLDSPTQITAVSPSGGAGSTVDITVHTCGGTSALSANDKFTYVAPPQVTLVLPGDGAPTGGNSVTISGSGFFADKGSSDVVSVKFGSSTAVFTTPTADTQITIPNAPAYTPGDPAVVDVVVTTNDGGASATSANDRYTWDFAAPVISSINPTFGPVAGGTSVALTGSGFLGVQCPSGVTFAATVATACSVTDDGHMTATSPAGSAGNAHIVVTNHGHASTPGAGDTFRYVARPVISSPLSPTSGPTVGGTSVTITGSGFRGGLGACNVSAVHFGTAAVSSVPVTCSDAAITVTSPAKANADPAVVDVTVTTDGGTSATSVSDQFAYVPPPTVKSISPISGPAAGGTPVDIAGSNFVSGATIKIGGVSATNVTFNSSSSLSAKTGAHSPGPVDVVVTNPDGQAGSKSSAYTYVAPPHITSLNITRGPTSGGTHVTITGTGFQVGAGVTFGAPAATNVTVPDSMTITLDTPANPAGAVDVVVTNPDSQTDTLAGGFTYVAAPHVTLASPNNGTTAGGDSVVITGTGFFGGTGSGNVASVSFGASSTTDITVTSDTQLTVNHTPPHAAATVDVRVTTDGGTSAVVTSGCPAASCDRFTYVAPTVIVDHLSPKAGPTAGGNPVHIIGSGFTGASAVAFGGTPAASFHVDSDTQITAVPPAGAAGLVDVDVTTAGGTGVGSNAYRYVAAPTVSAIAPPRGPLSGGTSVTLTGTGFRGGVGSGCDVLSITFDHATVSAVPGSCTDTGITITTPAQVNGDPNAVDVVVTTDGGASATNPGDVFTYVAAPTVTGSSPARGPAQGGTSVRVNGTGFFGGTSACNISAVHFGGNTAAITGVCTDTSVVVTSPNNGGSGTVDVTVATDGGTSATSANDHYVFTLPPTVTAVTPGSGSIYGGTSVTITGTEFFGGTGSCDIVPSGVNFGAAVGTNVTACTDTSVTATSPSLGSPATVDVTVTTEAGTSATGAADRFMFVYPPGPYVPLTPARIVDTRPGSGYPDAGLTLGPGGSLVVQVSGQGGVPADSTAVSAAVMNIAVTDTSAAGNLVVYPTGQPAPSVSNINWAAGQTLSNLTEVPLGSGGDVTLFNNGSGSVDVILDVNGYVSVSTAGNAGRFHALAPARIVDTRFGPYQGQVIPAGGHLDIQVTGATVSGGGDSGIPASGVSAVAFNVTATDATADSHLTVYPFGLSTPNAANLNFRRGETRGNRVIATLGSGGKISIFNNSGTVDVVVDVNGWFSDASASPVAGGLFNPLPPARILDTRAGTHVGPFFTIPAGQTQVLAVAGMGGIPAFNASTPPVAAVLHVTAVTPQRAGFLTFYPSGTVPNAADVNFSGGDVVGNLVVVKLNPADGTVKITNNSSGATDVVVDVEGWYS